MNVDQSYCTFTVGGGKCGVPVTRVHEVVCDQPITPVPLAHWSVRGLINLRGQILSVIDLGQLLGLATPESRAPELPPPESKTQPKPAGPRGRYHVIAEVGDELISLLVDEMGPVIAVLAGQLEKPPSNLDASAARLIAGAARLPDQVLLILDLDHTVNLQAGRSQADHE